ncbi:MAG: pyridoxamine 5'-phosphate oxidase family protein [Spirochaetia bacterium]|jgi:pyridoxamine 5'-phosphate oxidase|nr:pyridoxamine 5'-phosphate oxidase family protein [Spirochaetales bacterium]MDX9784154.1 pyridoxamine 5'-phosphate oxidase family protein [Spirochaetia bacterium]
MQEKSAFEKLQDLVEEVRIGIFITVDEKNSPHPRWMSPVFLPRLKGALYAVTAADNEKVRHLEANPRVSWIFQSKPLDRIATLNGLARVVKDPTLSAEVLEAIGPRLQVFWKYSGDPKKLLVVETILEDFSWFSPLKEGKVAQEIRHG